MIHDFNNLNDSFYDKYENFINLDPYSRFFDILVRSLECKITFNDCSYLVYAERKVFFVQ